MSPRQTLRYEGVQTLRFIAALLVVVTHATLYTSERLDPSLGVWRPGGIGVDIFFVISGFVMAISTVSLVPRPDGWRYFGMRRLVRIVPMYWIATTVKLLTMLVLPAAVLHAQLEPSRVVASYLFIPNRNAEGDVTPLLAVGWTLTFEMAFYAVFTVALLIRVRPLWFCAAAMSLLAIGSIWRADADFPPIQFYLDPVVLYFVVGMVIGQFALDGSRRRVVGWLLGVGALWFLIEVVGSGFGGDGWALFVQRLAICALVLLMVLIEPIISGRVPKLALFLGDSSYSLYLFHPLIAPIVPVVLGIIGWTNPTASVLITVAVAVVVAAAIYQLVERPLTRWLQRHLPYIHPHATGKLEAPVPER